jgi:hypothetical protein
MRICRNKFKNYSALASRQTYGRVIPQAKYSSQEYSE